MSLRTRLAEGPTLLLDGATGTELERRGARTGLPLWSSHVLLDDPELLERVHADYARAGCEILTANTFRTQRRTLATAGLGQQAQELTALAVACARRGAARAGSPALVAGSVAPLADCYRPDRVPDDETLREEHAQHVGNLHEAGVDLLLVETMNTIREAVAAVEAARATPLPVLASFVCDGCARLLSGEPLESAIAALERLAPDALLVNCLPPTAVPAALPKLRSSGRPFGVYANLGAPNDETGFTRSEDCSPEQFAELGAGWVQAGARIVGGCCGTSPAHLRRLAERLRR